MNRYNKLLKQLYALKEALEQLRLEKLELLKENKELQKENDEIRCRLAKTESDLAKTESDLAKLTDKTGKLHQKINKFGEKVDNGLYEVNKNIKLLNDVLAEINHLKQLPQTRNIKNRLYELDSEKLHRIQTIKFMLKGIGRKLVCENGVYTIE